MIAYGYNNFERGYRDKTILMVDYNESFPAQDSIYSMIINYWGTTLDLNMKMNFHETSPGNGIWIRGWSFTKVDTADWSDFSETFDLTPSADTIKSYTFEETVQNHFNDLTTAEQNIQNGIHEMLKGDIVTAAGYLQSAVSQYNDNVSIHALYRLIECQKNVELQELNLTSFFNSTRNSSSNKRIQFICDHALAQLQAKQGNYSNAIAIYESVMNNTQTGKMDSIDAAIYAGETYISEAEGVSTTLDDYGYSYRLSQVSVHGSYSDLKPTSLTHISYRADSLYALLNPSIIREFTIDDDQTWDMTDIYLSEDVTITSTGSLTILPGTWVAGDDITINVYGEIILDGLEEYPIHFVPATSGEPGINIVIHDGSSADSEIKYSNFKNSELALSIDEELNDPIYYCNFTECDTAIYVSGTNPLSLSVKHCSFVSSSQYSDIGLDLHKLESGEIDSCTFTGAMYPIIAVNGKQDILNCYIDNVDTLSTTANISAIDLTYCSGTVMHNTVYRYPTGIRLYDSDITVRKNKIEECFNEGIWLLHDSYPLLVQKNWLRYNGSEAGTPAQIRIEGSVYPFMKSGLNNVWQAANGYAVKSTNSPSSTTDLTNNYWGTSAPSASNLFNPYAAWITISPYESTEQIPTGGYQTSTYFDDLFAESVDLLEASEYETAKQNFVYIAQNDTTTGNRVGSVARLFQIYCESQDTLQNLIQILEDLSLSTDDDLVQQRAQHMIAQSQVELGNYQPAINHYESLILQPDILLEDSIFAVIDVGYVYLEAEENGLEKSTIDEFGELAYLKPRSRIAHERKISLLMELLRESSSRVQNGLEIPKEFALKPAYPNPFNPTVIIPFNVPKQSDVRIAIFNILGQEVDVLVDKHVNAGFHNVIWNSDKSSVSNVASGMYFVKMEAKGFVKSQKIVLMK